jgi:hypothetical protein
MEDSQEHEKELNEVQEDPNSDFILDFTTSSAITRIHLKFLLFYLLIFWTSGSFTVFVLIQIIGALNNTILSIILFPAILFALYFCFILGCAVVGKLLLVIINLIHKPKEGIFRAEKGNSDFEFWCLRTELKKLLVWLLNNCPIPYVDVWGFRWFGVKIDFSSHLNDAWVDVDFIKFGRKVMIGQGAIVMSSMVVGKYLIIKKVIFDDYTVIGGQSTIAPGTIIGKDTVIGALSYTSFKQVLEPDWIYFGMPAIKLKPNKYAEQTKSIIRNVEVDEDKRYELQHEVNIDDEKKDLVK